MGNLQREVHVAPAIVQLLKSIGVDVPDNMKEIQTPTEYSGETENKGSDKIVLNKAEALVVDTFVLDSLGEAGKRIYLFTGGYGITNT